MVGVQIPNLITAFSEPGRSEPTKFGEHLIAKNFTSIFRFKDGDKTWSAYFSIKITELGTPKLLSVEVFGSRAKHPKPLGKTWDASNMDELIERFNSPGKLPPIYSKQEIEEYERLSPEAESVERWQLGIRLAIELGNPMKKKNPEGGWEILYVHREPFSESEIKKLLKDIDKKIRQKITPDFLGEVARIYTEAGLRGERPIKAIEEFYKCSYRTAQDYATKARTLKLLPETTPGKVTVKKATKRREKK
jgi:predicted nucleic acid-binding protein